MKNMKAVVYKGDGIIRLEDRPIPDIQKDTDALVKVTLTTICSSDIHIKHGAVWCCYDRNTLTLPRRLYGNTNRRSVLPSYYSFSVA